MLESNQQPCPRAKGQSKVAQHPSLSSFQMLQPTQVRVKEAGSLFSRTVRLTGEKVSLGQRKWNWIQLGGYLSSPWPTAVSSDSTSANGQTHICESITGDRVQCRFWCIRFNMVQTYWAERKKKREPNPFGDFVWIYKKAGLKPAEYL